MVTEINIDLKGLTEKEILAVYNLAVKNNKGNVSAFVTDLIRKQIRNIVKTGNPCLVCGDKTCTIFKCTVYAEYMKKKENQSELKF